MLDTYQSQAVSTALHEKVMILTGGPGTGKSFTIKHVLEELNLEPEQIALAAPTGKAAKRMAELTADYEARTIHRLLEYSPAIEGFQRNASCPLTEDLIIIDESSMIDIRLMASLLKAIKPTARLILVGDKDQLPSVGPGQVFRDLIASQTIPVVELLEIHRQSDHSWITRNARRINTGQKLIEDHKSEDFFVVRAEEPEEVRRIILELITEKIPNIPSLKGKNAIADVQLLCPQKKGVLGVHEINQELQGLLNPAGQGKPEYRGFRAGDKVIHLKNNYDIEVMNGEVGLVAEIDPKAKKLTIDYDGRLVAYYDDDLEEITLNYAMTIHKSQGSEWPVVVIPVHSNNAFMLSRNLIYTAVTRGKQAVYLVGNDRGISRAIKNNEAITRHSGLQEYLRKATK